MQNPNAASIPSTSGNLMSQGGGVTSIQQTANQMGMNPNPNLAQQRQQQAQNPNASMLNQAMSAGNISALQQMKQNQLNAAAGMFSGGNAMAQSGGTMGMGSNQNAIQQRQQQVRLISFWNFKNLHFFMNISNFF